LRSTQLRREERLGAVLNFAPFLPPTFFYG